MVFDQLFRQQQPAMQSQGQGQSPYSRLLDDPRFAIGYGLLTSRENPLGAAMQMMGQGEQNRMAQEDRELKRQRLILGLDNPASVREYEYYNALPSDEEQQKFLGLKRAQQIVNLGGTQAVLDPMQGGIKEDFVVTPKPDQMPEFQADIVKAKGDAQRNVELETNKPFEQRKIASFVDQNSLLKESLADAKKSASNMTMGMAGSVLGVIPGTSAFDLGKKLDTIKANAGFDKLQDMRMNSPTGGALGNVAVQELMFLQSVYGNLEQSQSKEQFTENLDAFERAYDASMQRVRDAYNQTYGTDEGFQNAMQSRVTGGNQQQGSGNAPQPKGLPEGARQAPDGNYYVEQNGKFFKVNAQ